MQRLAVERGQSHRRHRNGRGRTKHIPGHEEQPDRCQRQQLGRHHGQHLPSGQSRDGGDAGQRVIDRVLRRPQRIHLVDRLRDVDAGGIGVLEKLPHTGGHVGVGASAHGGGVLLHGHHWHQRHAEHQDCDISRPRPPAERQLWPAASSHPIAAERQPRGQHQGQRDGEGNGGEAQNRHRQADRAGAGRQDPQQLVPAERRRQQQPHGSKAADGEQHHGGGDRPQGVGERPKGRAMRSGSEVPREREDRQQERSCQRPGGDPCWG